jgi:hypothetical protein
MRIFTRILLKNRQILEKMCNHFIFTSTLNPCENHSLENPPRYWWLKDYIVFLLIPFIIFLPKKNLRHYTNRKTLRTIVFDISKDVPHSPIYIYKCMFDDPRESKLVERRNQLNVISDL